MNLFRAAVPVFITSLVAAGVSAPRAQSPDPAHSPDPIWKGAFTAAQAERGRAVMQLHCSECHGENLGGGEGPALAGPTFMLKWETHTVERLFHKIRDTMPSRDDTDVTEREKLDTVAYILQQNGFPAGSAELVDAPGALAAIRMMPKEGPSAPRSGALVQVVGCLVETAPGKWAVSASSEPVMTTLDPMSAADKTSLAASPRGAQSIELLSVFPRPAAIVGHTVLVKGLFIKTATDTRINVTLLESLAPGCSSPSTPAAP